MSCGLRKRDLWYNNPVSLLLLVVRSYLTHFFTLRKEEAPVCVACNVVLTVKHILIEYADLLEIKKKYFEEKSLYSLFLQVSHFKSHHTTSQVFFSLFIFHRNSKRETACGRVIYFILWAYTGTMC